MKLKRGERVEVTFWDHVMGRRELVKCKTLGWIESWDDEKLVLKWWQVGDRSLARDNDENYTLVRSAIVRIEPL